MNSHLVYKHYKGGFYEKLYTAYHRDHEKSKSMDHAIVVYKSLSDERIYWATYHDFNGVVPTASGAAVPRFEFSHQVKKD